MFPNTKFKYLLNNDPNITLSKKGSNVRRKIRPLFIKLLKLSSKLQLTIEKNEFVRDGDKPVIFIASHGFKDDAINTILTTKANAYIIAGNIDLFFNTMDGLGLWIYGTQLVDRYDKQSKHAMKDKMNKIIEMGDDIIIYPEATWNLSPNKPMENLHAGFYDVALKNDALVVPVLTHKVGNKCYSRVLNAIDVKNFTRNDILYIFLLIKKYANLSIDMLENHSEISNDMKNIFNKILEETNVIFDDYDSLQLMQKIERIENICSSYLKVLQKYILSVNSGENNNIIDLPVTLDVLKRIELIIKRISIIKKFVMVKKIRDIMALEKVDMYRQHPDYSYMKNGKNMYDAWNDYIDDTISATPYFYVEPESTTVFKDPLEDDYDTVMKLKK